MRPGPVLAITVPKRYPVDLHELIKGKERWIERKFEEVSSAKRLITDETIMYRGEVFNIRSSPEPRGELRLSGSTVHVFCPPQKQPRLIREFLTQETRKYVSDKIAELTEELGLTCRETTTRQMKKWGYCTRDGRIVFNWRLICLPQRLIDYVVLHEVMHLKHFDHSKRFKAALGDYMPEFDELDSSLKSYLTA